MNAYSEEQRRQGDQIHATAVGMAGYFAIEIIATISRTARLTKG
jgi:hypothetical protein